jgi:acetolactate synthase-1/2/3 large subunit
MAALAPTMAPHDYLPITGGAIGIGIPLATGAAVACPDRKVVALQADGSGMYTVQGLWTQARERLDVRTVVFSNRGYSILKGELGNPPAVPAPSHPKGEVGRGKITSEAFAASIAAMLPENAIVADESVTFGRAFFQGTHHAAPHDWLNVTGGAIGGGIPLATGAAVAGVGRRVVNLQADGSAMYTIQGLWTQARERLDVTTVIFNNRKYQILIGELANVGANPGRTAMDMLDLGNPDIDFVKLAEGQGVEGARATTMEQFNDLFAASLTRKGPFVIELMT